ncbi:MAG: hypothetical protein ABIP51_18120 [Bacteroidia bacterium]
MITTNPNGKRTIQLEVKDLRINSKTKSVSDLTRSDFSIKDLDWNGASKIFYMGDGKIKVIKSPVKEVVETTKPDYIQLRELNQPDEFRLRELNDNPIPIYAGPVHINTTGIKQDEFVLPKEELKPISFYQMSLNNMVNYLKTFDPAVEGSLNAFDLSAAAAIIFCKSKEEIMHDIINFSK